MNDVEKQIYNSAVNIKQNSVDDYVSNVVTEEMTKYQQSPYFNYYLAYYNGTDEFSKHQINEYKMLYIKNLNEYHNPYYKETQRGFILNIGYPVPDYYIDILLNAYKEAFIRNNGLEDSEFSISITPLEYSDNKSNIIKHSNGYQLQLQMVKKIEKKSELSK